MLERQRELIGSIGWRFLMVLAVPIHTATVVIAFLWFGGFKGILAGTVSALIPVVPELYWAMRVTMTEGTIWHWYVLAVIAYPVVWILFLIGGTLFAPEMVTVESANRRLCAARPDSPASDQ